MQVFSSEYCDIFKNSSIYTALLEAAVMFSFEDQFLSLSGSTI